MSNANNFRSKGELGYQKAIDESLEAITPEETEPENKKPILVETFDRLEADDKILSFEANIQDSEDRRTTLSLISERDYSAFQLEDGKIIVFHTFEDQAYLIKNCYLIPKTSEIDLSENPSFNEIWKFLEGGTSIEDYDEVQKLIEELLEGNLGNVTKAFGKTKFEMRTISLDGNHVSFSTNQKNPSRSFAGEVLCAISRNGPIDLEVVFESDEDPMQKEVIFDQIRRNNENARKALSTSEIY